MRQADGKNFVRSARCVAVLLTFRTVAVPFVVDVHAVDQQKIGVAAAAQVFCIGKHVRIGVRVLVVENAVLNRAVAVKQKPVFVPVKRGLDVQLAYPMVGRGRRFFARFPGAGKYAFVIRIAHDIVVENAAFLGRYAGKYRFV